MASYSICIIGNNSVLYTETKMFEIIMPMKEDIS